VPSTTRTPPPALPRTVTVSPATVSSDPNASDFRVLGVPVGSDLGTVQSAYEKLALRCDPRRFPDGSQEQKDAQRILERVNVAFESLRKRLDPTENRFGRLELE
ncbi:MAG: J domain-containing protein, partial [Cytophagales bacterium]|nr:J domain-containing protein [Armatimonadota bacterium]